jgi:hypothetical protein
MSVSQRGSTGYDGVPHGRLILAGLVHGMGPKGLGIEVSGDGGGHTAVEEVEGAVLGHAHIQLDPRAEWGRVGLGSIAVALSACAGAPRARRPALVALDPPCPGDSSMSCAPHLGGQQKEVGTYLQVKHPVVVLVRVRGVAAAEDSILHPPWAGR